MCQCQARQQTDADPNDVRPKWTEVVTQKSNRNPTQKKNRPNGTSGGVTASSTTAATASTSTTTTTTTAVAAASTEARVEKASEHKMPRVKVQGVRRL